MIGIKKVIGENYTIFHTFEYIMILKYLSDKIKQEWHTYYKSKKLQFRAIDVKYGENEQKALLFQEKFEDFVTAKYEDVAINSLAIEHFKHNIYTYNIVYGKKLYKYLFDGNMDLIIAKLSKELFRSKGKLDIFGIPVSCNWYIPSEEVSNNDLEITNRYTAFYVDFLSKVYKISQDEVNRADAEEFGETCFNNPIMVGGVIGKILKEVRDEELIPNVIHEEILSEDEKFDYIYNRYLELMSNNKKDSEIQNTIQSELRGYLIKMEPDSIKKAFYRTQKKKLNKISK